MLAPIVSVETEDTIDIELSANIAESLKVQELKTMMQQK